MSEKTDKIYCGNGRLYNGKFGIVPKMSMSRSDVNTIVKFMKDNKLEWINLEMLEKKNKEEKKPTHYICVDTFKPEKHGDKTEPAKIEPVKTEKQDNDDLPF